MIRHIIHFGFLHLLLFVLYGCEQGIEDQQAIRNNHIAAAERIIGIKFDKTERDSLCEDLLEQRNDYDSIRTRHIPNEVPPALIFNPIPVDYPSIQGESIFQMKVREPSSLPEDLEKLAFFSIRDLAYLLKTRQITSLELTRFFINRLKKYDHQLKCVITVTEELAIEEAKKADEEISAGYYRGLLHGIPYGAKDLLAVKGYKTTWGATPYKDQRLDNDASVIKKLRESGAVLVAKLTLGALAWGDVWYQGKTRNPWNPDQGSSGSSAGSAAATAAGLVPFAIGSETWGSIVSPSTRCGTSGLRPTFGRISRAGAMALSWSMDKLGPICRSVEDCAIVFNAIYGPDGLDQTVMNLPFKYQADRIEHLKIGYLKKLFDRAKGDNNSDIRTLNKLRELGIELHEIELPSIPVKPISFILSAEAAAAFDELTRSDRDDLMVRQIRNAWPNVFRAARFIPAVEYIQANRIRHQLIQEMQKVMQQVDIYVTPSFGGDNLLLTNLTGHPCVVLPNGFNEKESPISISFIGQLFKEGDLLAFAQFYQESTDFHKKHPPLFIQ